MTDIDSAGIMREELDILREELDELHERLAVLTDRVISLEGDRDVLLAALETQSEMNERSDAWHEQLTRLFEQFTRDTPIIFISISTNARDSRSLPPAEIQGVLLPVHPVGPRHRCWRTSPPH